MSIASINFLQYSLSDTQLSIKWLWCKYCPGSNALAYYSLKGFRILDAGGPWSEQDYKWACSILGVNVIKPFFHLSQDKTKLGCLSLAKLFKPSLRFVR